jgi:hypothetical protein
MSICVGVLILLQLRLQMRKDKHTVVNCSCGDSQNALPVVDIRYTRSNRFLQSTNKYCTYSLLVASVKICSAAFVIVIE